MLVTHVRFGLGQSEIIGTSGGCVGRFLAPLATISTNDCPQTFYIPGWSRVERTVGCSSGSVLQSFALVFLPWILNKFKKTWWKLPAGHVLLSSDLQFGNCICRFKTDLSPVPTLCSWGFLLMRVQSYTKRRVQKSDKTGSTTELGLSRVKQDWQGFLLRPTGCSFFYTLFCVDVIWKQEWCMNLLLWEIFFEIFFKVLSFVWVWLFSQGKMVC